MSTQDASIAADIAAGRLEAAATALDAAARRDRARYLPQLLTVLDTLAVVHNGVTFRYVPATTVSIGDDVGEEDERPAHMVQTPALWMAQTPVLCGQMQALFQCTVVAARRDLFSSREASRFQRYDQPECPAIALTWSAATSLSTSLAAKAQGKPVVGRLPTEAEWERAARGCLVGAEYPWGDAPPDGTRADFGRFGDWVLRPPIVGAPNDYGLFAMAGTVWEWCGSPYAPYVADGEDPVHVERPEMVLRGGSFTDDDIALRVAFRLSAAPTAYGPNIGFRPVLVRPDRP